MKLMRLASLQLSSTSTPSTFAIWCWLSMRLPFWASALKTIFRVPLRRPDEGPELGLVNGQRWIGKVLLIAKHTPLCVLNDVQRCNGHLRLAVVVAHVGQHLVNGPVAVHADVRLPSSLRPLHPSPRQLLHHLVARLQARQTIEHTKCLLPRPLVVPYRSFYSFAR